MWAATYSRLGNEMVRKVAALKRSAVFRLSGFFVSLSHDDEMF